MMRDYLLSTTALRAPDDTGATVAEVVDAANEAQEAASEAVAAASEADRAASDVAGLEIAAEIAEERAEAAEEGAAAILEGAAEIEARRGVDELWRDLDGLRERSAGLESRLLEAESGIAAFRETMARMEGMMLTASLASQSQTEPSSSMPQQSPLPLDPTISPEVPEPDLIESPPAGKVRKRIRLI